MLQRQRPRSPAPERRRLGAADVDVDGVEQHRGRGRADQRMTTRRPTRPRRPSWKPLRSAGFDVWKGNWPAELASRFRGTLNGPQSPGPTEAPIRIVIGAEHAKALGGAPLGAALAARLVTPRARAGV